MTLDNSEDFASAQEYLIDEGLLDAPVDPDQFDENPFDYLAAENRQGTFHRSFRPQIIAELDDLEDEEEFEQELKERFVKHFFLLNEPRSLEESSENESK